MLDVRGLRRVLTAIYEHDLKGVWTGAHGPQMRVLNVVRSHDAEHVGAVPVGAVGGSAASMGGMSAVVVLRAVAIVMVPVIVS